MSESNIENSEAKPATTTGHKTEVLTIQGKRLNVRTMGFRQATLFLATLTKVLKTADIHNGLNVYDLIAAAGGELCYLLAIATGKPEEYFDTLSQDEGIEIAKAVWTVNQEQFIKKTIPSLTEAFKIQSLATAVVASTD